MSQPAKAQEPSMEEILASIRRIIADDDASKTARPPEPAPPPVAAVPSRPAPPPPRPAPPPVMQPAPSRALDQDAVDKVMAQPMPAPAPKTEPEDVLDLTESMAMAGEAPSPAPFRTIDGESDIVFSDPAPDPPGPRRAADDGRRYVTPAPVVDRSILSQSTAAAVDSAFNSLANTVLGQNARTLEDLVKEMLRPMLKGWLDDNLPGLVERIVRAEIERVSRGR